LQGYLPGFDEYIKPQKDDLYGKWEAASEREKRSRTLFAQETIKVDEVARELHAVQAAIGSGVDVADFTRRTLAVFGAQTTGTDPLDTNLTEASSALKDVLAQSSGFDLTNPKFRFRFNQPVQEDEHYLQRTHPFVEMLANHVLETALDPLSGDAVRYPAARRCGAIRTKVVDKRGTRKAATAYLEFLFSPAAQEIIAKHHFRPRDKAVQAKYAHAFPKVNLVTVDEDFGGWAAAQKRFFADGGVFDRIFVKSKK
jgi:hypothetical protein